MPPVYVLLALARPLLCAVASTSLFSFLCSHKHRFDSILKALGHKVWHSFEKSGKVKTVIPYRMEHQNQASGKSIYTDFVIFMYICSKPVFFVIPAMSLSHSSKFGYPFGLHFGQYVATILNLIFKHKKSKRSECCVLLGQT